MTLFISVYTAWAPPYIEKKTKKHTGNLPSTDAKLMLRLPRANEDGSRVLVEYKRDHENEEGLTTTSKALSVITWPSPVSPGPVCLHLVDRGTLPRHPKGA